MSVPPANGSNGKIVAEAGSDCTQAPMQPGTCPKCGKSICGGKRKQRGGYACHMVQGTRTGHLGEGRCFLHGGATPIRHGRYSTLAHTSVGARIQRFLDDPDPLDLTPELGLLRGLLERYVEQLEEEGEGEGPDASGARLLVGEIGKLVFRIEKIRAQYAISAPEFYRLMGQAGRVVQTEVANHVKDADLADRLMERIREGWLGMQVRTNEIERGAR